MDASELKKLNRTELLELLLEVTRENERLKKRLKIYEEAVQDREIAIAESGSLAEAAMKISGVLEAAQEAADLYLENIMRMERELAERQDDEA
jgi:hypothetical protein